MPLDIVACMTLWTDETFRGSSLSGRLSSIQIHISAVQSIMQDMVSVLSAESSRDARKLCGV